MLEGLSDKQLSTVVEGEVPPQREHERDRQVLWERDFRAVGCGGEGVGYFCERLEGGQGEEGALKGCYLPLTWKRLPGEGCPPSGADILNLGQKAKAETDGNPPQREACES